jgi:hypothetical protein
MMFRRIINKHKTEAGTQRKSSSSGLKYEKVQIYDYNSVANIHLSMPHSYCILRHAKASVDFLASSPAN